MKRHGRRDLLVAHEKTIGMAMAKKPTDADEQKTDHAAVQAFAVA